MQETIFCTATASTNGSQGYLSLHDIQTGATLGSFKQTNTSQHCTAIVETRNGQGGFVLAAQSDKSILNVYTFQKDQVNLKIVLPEKLTCIAMDSCGTFCAGGTTQGRIYFWEVASGIMYNAWDAHYRQINVLSFTRDNSALLSGSEDAGMSVWSVSRIVDDSLQSDLPSPYCTLTDHTLPVTDIACGVGTFPNCRILTSSVDHSVKLWDLASRSLLCTFQFPRPISFIVWDPTERTLFAASADGSIHQMNFFRQRDIKTGGQLMEVVNGGDVNEIISLGKENRDAWKNRLISVGQQISSMCISLTATLLLVGTETGSIHIYDIPSHQLLRTITSHKGLAITHVTTMLKPPDLIGHIDLNLTSSDTSDTIPVRPVAPFQRMKDPKAREKHEITILVPGRKIPQVVTAYKNEELLRDVTVFTQSSNAEMVQGKENQSLKAKADNLEAEVTLLREQLAKAKAINDIMWDTLVQRTLNAEKSENITNDENDEPNKTKKRGKA